MNGKKVVGMNIREIYPNELHDLLELYTHYMSIAYLKTVTVYKIRGLLSAMM